MDIRDILKSFDQLSEATTTTNKGVTTHKGDYGREFDTDDEGNPVVKKVKSTEPKKQGRRPDPNKPLTGKNDPKNKKMADLFGRTTGDVPDGKEGTKFSKMDAADKEEKKREKDEKKGLKKKGLKEYFDQLDQALNEGDQIEIKPASQMPKQPGQTSQPGQQQQVAGQPPMNTQVIQQGSKTLGTVDNPQLAQQIKQSIGKGEMTLMPDQQMAEDGENWIKGAIKHPGAFTKKASSHGMTPKEFANKVLAHKKDYPAKTEKQAQLAKTLGKMHEAEAPPTAFQSSPLSTNNRGVLEGKKGVNPFAKKDDKTAKKDNKAEMIGKKVTKTIEKVKEGAKPDFPDIDNDNNTTEPISKAAQDAKKTKKKMKEGMEHHLQAARLEGKSHALRKMPYNCTHDDMEEARHYHEGFKEGLDECYGQMPILGRTAVDEMGPGSEVDTMASYGAHDEMDEGTAFTAGLAKTPHGGKFKVGGSTFTDRTRYDSNLDEFAFESLDKQLNSLLESEEVSEGMTVSISKGQQGSPDSVSVSAQDGEADQLLSIIKSSGMGLFGGDEQNGYGAPQGSTQAPGGIEVVDDHDGMMALMKKLSGAGAETSNGDYESEEGHGEEGHSHDEEDSCNECGMAYESCGCDHDEPIVDEEESRDQMLYNVAEDNPPDSGAAETAADDASEAGEDAALATADAAQDEEEGQVYSSPTEGKEDTTGEEAGKEELEEGTCKKCDCNPCKCETMSESSFFNLFRKISMLSEESTSEKDDKAEEAGEEVKKDIEYDDKKDKKDKKLDEWANEAGKNGTDASFEADIDFMTKVISGGLNKQKSTGQTTIPVINGQKSRMGVDGLGSPMKESTDLLKDYRKLSGL